MRHHQSRGGGRADRAYPKTMPPLKGILHAATAYDDALIANLDAQRMSNVLRPKLLGAWHLHELTLDLPLAHFVLYSSITTLIGNVGQANYVAANAGLEALARLRHSLGLPATCIGWGAIADAGFLSRNEAVKQSLAQRLGAEPFTAHEALAALDHLLRPDAEPFAVARFNWAVLSRALPSAHNARFAELSRTHSNATETAHAQDIRALIAHKSPQEIASIVREWVTQEVAQILAIRPERILPERSLHDLGMDSLMAVELALGLEQRFDIRLPVMMLNDSPTVENVTARIVEKLMGSADIEEPPTPAGLVQQLASQHGEAMTPEEIEAVAQEAHQISVGGAERSARTRGLT